MVQRRQLFTALNPLASGSTDMRGGCTIMDARQFPAEGGERRASAKKVPLRGRR